MHRRARSSVSWSAPASPTARAGVFAHQLETADGRILAAVSSRLALGVELRWVAPAI
ncbi:MAG: hypothetical protein M5U07_08340 [Xanthobacteraceae bacterium]|nr:hypothetical protein [Xanthobacteraceae bacterium]